MGRGRTGAMTASVLVGALALAGCSASATYVKRSGPATSTARSDGVTVTLKVDRTSVPRGGAIKTDLIFDNESRTSVPWPCLVNGYFTVMLEDDAHPARFWNGVVGCGPVAMRHGRTVLSSTIAAVYSECIGPGGQSSDDTPKCGPHGAFPSLPVGTYRTAIYFDGVTPLIPRPKPITVVVTDGPEFEAFPTPTPSASPTKKQ